MLNKLFLALLLTTNLAIAESSFFKNISTPEVANDPVNADTAFKFDIFKVDENTLKAVWDIREDYYLYDDKFGFKINGADLGEIKFPKGKEKEDEFFGNIVVHKKQVSVDIPLKNITQNIDLTIDYQGCWEGGVCYPPITKNKSFSFDDLNIKPQGVEKAVKKIASTPAKTEQSNLSATTQELSEEEQVVKDFEHESHFWILVSFFGAGILAAFTSCVLPMIPILSGIIIGSENPTKKKAFIMSVVFVVFMAITYAVIGVLFGLFGSNLQTTLQNPWVISTFSVMFVALAFSMFGYYEIKIPNALQNKLTNISKNQKGGHLIGVAIMGVLSALIVGPCAAPVLSGALLYIGNSGDAVLGGSALFVMGLGMGLPLIAAGVGVATPRPGVWMDTIKAIFGVIMLGTAIYFLERILDEDITLIMWATLLTISPIALGVFSIASDNKPISRLFKGVGLLIFGYGLLLWILVAKGGISSGGDMFAPLKNIGGSATVVKVEKVKFEYIKDLTALQQITKNSDKIVMVDFYADWCIYCKTYDKKVFNHPEVAQKLRTFKLVKIDITKNTTVDAELLKHFKISAPPAILFFKNGVELRNKRIIGEKNAQQFYEIINNL